MRLLLTRPRPQSQALARRLRRMGHTVLVAPVLEICGVPGPAPSLEGVQALLLTSARAASAVPPAGAGLPVLAVGRATARAALRAGCRRVVSADGDALALARLTAATLHREAGALLHLAGEETRPELEEALRAAGFELRRQTVYRAVATSDLPPHLARALAGATLEAALLLSPRSAGILARLVQDAGLERGLAGCKALCLSAAVAAAAAGLPWREILVAPRPDQASLLGLLDAPGRRW